MCTGKIDPIAEIKRLNTLLDEANNKAEAMRMQRDSVLADREKLEKEYKELQARYFEADDKCTEKSKELQKVRAQRDALIYSARVTLLGVTE